MKPISSVEISEFINKCPNYDGRMYYTCITECFEKDAYISKKCKKVKEEYNNYIKKLLEGNTR